MIIITALLSLAVVGLSIYGNNVGNFVISVEEDTRLSLSLSETGVFKEDATALLSAKGMRETTNATYANIPLDINDHQGGEHNDWDNRRYTAYTFYLKNTSSIAVSYNMTLSINEVYRNVDAAVRILIIKDGEESIYAKRRSDGMPEEHLDITRPYSTIPFISSSKVCDVYTPVLNSDSMVKYTVVLWLEGYDKECVDYIKGGAIRFTMNFTAQ